MGIVSAANKYIRSFHKDALQDVQGSLQYLNIRSNLLTDFSFMKQKYFPSLRYIDLNTQEYSETSLTGGLFDHKYVKCVVLWCVLVVLLFSRSVPIEMHGRVQLESSQFRNKHSIS